MQRIMLESLKLFYVGGEAEKLAMSVMKNKILKPIVLDFYKQRKKLTSKPLNICSKNTLLKTLA